MADAAAISRWFPSRAQRCQNFAEFCFDRGVDSLPQLEIIAGIPSGLGCQRHHCHYRDSFIGNLFALPDRPLHHQHLHASIAFDLDFFLPSCNRHSPGARGPWNIGNHRQRDRGRDAGSAAHSAGDSPSHLDRCPPPNRRASRALRPDFWRGPLCHYFHGSIFRGHLVDDANAVSHRHQSHGGGRSQAKAGGTGSPAQHLKNRSRKGEPSER